jgi:hypothetical protein
MVTPLQPRHPRSAALLAACLLLAATSCRREPKAPAPAPAPSATQDVVPAQDVDRAVDQMLRELPDGIGNE